MAHCSFQEARTAIEGRCGARRGAFGHRRAGAGILSHGVEDITVNFVAEGEFATHYTSLEFPRPSHFSFEALEDTIVVAFSYEYLDKLRTVHAELERLVRYLIEHEYARLLAHTESLLIRNGEERYRLFLKNFGALMPRISVADLSSYLGLSRQNVTLIRKRLLQG